MMSLYEFVMMLLPMVTHEHGTNLSPQAKPSRFTCPVWGMDPTTMEFNVVRERNEYAIRVIEHFMQYYLVIRTCCIAIVYIFGMFVVCVYYFFDQRETSIWNVLLNCGYIYEEFMMYNWSLRWFSKLMFCTHLIHYSLEADVTVLLIIMVTRMCIVLVQWFRFCQNRVHAFKKRLKFYLRSVNEAPHSTCPICVTCIPDRIILPCSHTFCNECIQKYNDISPMGHTCPLCRSQIFRIHHL